MAEGELVLSWLPERGWRLLGAGGERLGSCSHRGHLWSRWGAEGLPRAGMLPQQCLSSQILTSLEVISDIPPHGN